MEKVRRLLIISSDESLKEILHFCFDGWGYEVFLWSSYDGDIVEIKKMSPHVIILDVYSAEEENLSLCRYLKEDFITASIPVITLINKRHLRSHLLNLKYGVDDYLIKPPDPLDLRIRIEMAIRRSQYSLYASPLTGLPGGRVIEEAVSERIKKEVYFSFGYVDIDNFKYYNDVYGYVKGDQIIMQTAYILYNTIREIGNSDDFVGHIGGDDFVFITTPDKYKVICQAFIFMFERVCPFHYSYKDRVRGFIVARDRMRKVRRMPLMSVSVAVVNVNDRLNIKSIIDINERVAEIKKYLKSISGSKFMVERRNSSDNSSLTPFIFRRDDSWKGYKPLGQILLERQFITEQQLEEALRIHWRRGVMFGEIIKELGFIKEEHLNEALRIQKSIAQ